MVTPQSISVVSQDGLDAGFSRLLWERMNTAENLDRFGWYYQQFLKIEALRVNSADNLIIWDADCVPTTRQSLFDDDANPIYMEAYEYKEEYFRMIERLLQIQRVQSQSFVIPGFPIKKEWVVEFLDQVEKMNPGMLWFEAILNATDLSSPTGFSETETLGTWVANLHPNEWRTKEVSWERMGQGKFGYAKDFTPESVVALGQKHELDIVSFENWDPRGLMRQWTRIKLLFSKHLARHSTENSTY